MKTAQAYGPSPMQGKRLSFGNLFCFGGKVTRADYLWAGLACVPVKYSVEAIAIYGLAGKLFTPLDFLNPWLSGREYFTADAPIWFGMAWVLWSMVFLWIGVVLSVRRSIDLGWSPWLGLVVAIPIVNFAGIALWSLLPSKLDSDRNESQAPPEQDHSRQSRFDDDYADTENELSSELPLEVIYRSGHTRPYLPEPSERESDAFLAAVLGIAVGVGYMLLMVLASTIGFESYGAALFFGAPIVTGAVAAYFRNRPVPVPIGTTILHSAMTLSIACCAFLVLGIEGIICIAMAVPVVVPLGLLGAFLGRSIAVEQYSRRHYSHRGLYSCMVVLPMLVPLENYLRPSPEFEIASEIEIAAPIEIVWKNVIDFPAITDEPEWFFRLGVAYPQRARIDGAGVGAIRHCEFTTGVFVEPITVWDEPYRLAFDVAEQPEPMFELTPYRHIHPPHLDGAFRSVRGEFRLRALGPYRTLLQGSTWYQLDIHPVSYWTLWTDWIVHRIHVRVLEHIRRNAESQVR